jgi:hypothetical protein
MPTKMKTAGHAELNKPYLLMVLLLMLVLPCISIIIEIQTGKQSLTIIDLIGKWFVFWSIGVRLLVAGIKQAINPAFTAAGIFHLKDPESEVVVRELGYANICLGLVGIVSLFIPHWRIVSACSGGLYMGIAGVNHIIKKPAGTNEVVAMVSDIFIALVAAAWVLLSR